jgi:two-component system OmpR family sensor kinase
VRVPIPLVTAALALAGAMAATIYLYVQADQAVASMIDQRLSGAGTAASLLVGAEPEPERLLALAKAESLDGAFLVDQNLQVRADTNGPTGRSADLLRVDPERVAAAFAGSSSIGRAYDVGGVTVRTGYFPVRSAGKIVAVLGLEAGVAFSGPSHRLDRALAVSALLALLGAAALALIASRQVRVERAQQQALARAARAELLAQIAAAAAHEIRNPLGVIRGTVELMQERSGSVLTDRDRAALADVLSEVERLKQLTEDLLDLSIDRPLAIASIQLAEVLRETITAAQQAFPQTTFELRCPPLPLTQGDAGRLRQVFLNLLQNAAQARSGARVTVSGQAEANRVRVTVSDDGPGISPEVAARLFEPFVTARTGGTGLGLAICRKLVERHQGSLRNLEAPAGASFEVILPAGNG